MMMMIIIIIIITIIIIIIIIITLSLVLSTEVLYQLLQYSGRIIEVC
jgi:hypothetical protein